MIFPSIFHVVVVEQIKKLVETAKNDFSRSWFSDDDDDDNEIEAFALSHGRQLIRKIFTLINELQNDRNGSLLPKKIFFFIIISGFL